LHDADDGEALPYVVGSQHQSVGHAGRHGGIGIGVLGGSTSLPLRLATHSAHVAITPFCCHGTPTKTIVGAHDTHRLGIPAGRIPNGGQGPNALVKRLFSDSSKTYLFLKLPSGSVPPVN
jgi:hypothetical protein